MRTDGPIARAFKLNVKVRQMLTTFGYLGNEPRNLPELVLQLLTSDSDEDEIRLVIGN